MKFDIFCEIQIAKPWPPEHERQILMDTVEQARAADRAGFEVWWQVEHHGAPEFSYSAAPEVVLTAIAMATKRLHVGHAGVLAPFKINGPLRVAERAATLDILSGGRFELGLAKSGGKEWETFGVNPETARGELREAHPDDPEDVDRAHLLLGLQAVPDAGARDRAEAAVQKPHPRMWQTASSPDSFRMAGELGIGVLGTTLLSPVEFMKSMLDEYEAGIAVVQDARRQIHQHQKGVFTFVHVAETRKQAIESGAAWSALWYVHAAPIIFKVPRAVWWDQIRAGLNPQLARNLVNNQQTAALTASDPDQPRRHAGRIARHRAPEAHGARRRR